MKESILKALQSLHMARMRQLPWSKLYDLLKAEGGSSLLEWKFCKGCLTHMCFSVAAWPVHAEPGTSLTVGRAIFLGSVARGTAIEGNADAKARLFWAFLFRISGSLAVCTDTL